MPRATPDEPVEEELISRYLAEAGDPHVEPRPEHVARLRALLLERLGPPRPHPAQRSRTHLLAGSGLALVGSGLAAAVVLLLVTLSQPAIAWPQVAQALQGRPWMRGKVIGPDGKELFEQWLSSDRGRGGQRAGTLITFHDYKRKILTKYVLAEGVVYRLPEPPEGTPGETNFLRQLLDQLLDPAGPPRFPFPGMELIGQARRAVEHDGKKWLEIELSLRVAGGSRGPDGSMLIRINPATKLPVSLVFDAEDGKRYSALIDYPDRGPVDIYDMGAPRAATVVDRSPPGAVGSVLAGLGAGRRHFDDYRAFVVEETVKGFPGHDTARFTAFRLWRKGPRWRVERLPHGQRDWAPPPDADTTWWKEHEGDFRFIPQIVCDGRADWRYYLVDDWKPGMPVPKPGERDTHVGQTVGPNQLMGPIDDPILPFWCQALFPEQAGHLNEAIGQPDSDREFLVESNPKEGPTGTILFRCADTKPTAVGAPDHFRLWVDPTANYLSMRAEIRVGEAGDPSKVAWIDTHIVEALEKSPKGFAYPTRTRQVTHNGQREVVRTFFVDFDGRLPDELFQPITSADHQH
jgi:hypothetical protein